MVLGEAFAIRKLVVAGYSEQFSWCYKGAVMGPARMKLMQGREQHELKRKKKILFRFFF